MLKIVIGTMPPAYISNICQHSASCPGQCLVYWVDGVYKMLEHDGIVDRLFSV